MPKTSATPAAPTPPAARASRLRWLYPLALAGMVVIASGRGQVAAPGVAGFDKLAHFAIFGLLATLVARSPGVHRFRYAILLASGFGIADEFRQSFTPGRAVELADWMADTAGAVTAILLYRFWPAYRQLLETPLRLPLRRRGASSPGSRSAPRVATADFAEDRG